mgnify:FL=1
MNHSKNIIAIAGNARSGKDTLGKYLVSILKEYGISAKTYSFADELKKETDEFLMRTLGISAFTQDDEEKKIIRPFLVFWGTDLRRKMNPSVWVDKVSTSIQDNEVAIITDLRFGNELKWVKQNDGRVIFISRIDSDGEIIPPANLYEKVNNRSISKGADNNLTWITSDDENLLKSLANEALDSILTLEKFESWKATCH